MTYAEYYYLTTEDPVLMWVYVHALRSVCYRGLLDVRMERSEDDRPEFVFTATPEIRSTPKKSRMDKAVLGPFLHHKELDNNEWFQAVMQRMDYQPRMAFKYLRRDVRTKGFVNWLGYPSKSARKTLHEAETRMGQLKQKLEHQVEIDLQKELEQLGEFELGVQVKLARLGLHKPLTATLTSLAKPMKHLFDRQGVYIYEKEPTEDGDHWDDIGDLY